MLILTYFTSRCPDVIAAERIRRRQSERRGVERVGRRGVEPRAFCASSRQSRAKPGESRDTLAPIAPGDRPRSAPVPDAPGECNYSINLELMALTASEAGRSNVASDATRPGRPAVDPPGALVG